MERDHLEEKDIDWRIILQQSFKKCNVGMDYCGLGQCMNMWPFLCK